MLAPKSNPSLAFEELYILKQGSMTSREFHAQITKTAKRCNFSNKEAEERAIRDVLYMGMNSTHARDKTINLMNGEGKELTMEFSMQHLEIKDSDSHHKFLRQYLLIPQHWSTLFHVTIDRTRHQRARRTREMEST